MPSKEGQTPVEGRTEVNLAIIHFIMSPGRRLPGDGKADISVSSFACISVVLYESLPTLSVPASVLQ